MHQGCTTEMAQLCQRQSWHGDGGYATEEEPEAIWQPTTGSFYPPLTRSVPFVKEAVLDATTPSKVNASGPFGSSNILNARKALQHLGRSFCTRAYWAPGLGGVAAAFLLVYILSTALFGTSPTVSDTFSPEDPSAAERAVQRRLLLWLATAPTEACVSARDIDTLAGESLGDKAAPNDFAAVGVRHAGGTQVLWRPTLSSREQLGRVHIERTPLCRGRAAAIEMARVVVVAYTLLLEGDRAEPRVVRLEGDTAYCLQHSLLTLQPHGEGLPSNVVCEPA